MQIFKRLKLGKKNKHPEKVGVDFKSLPTLLTIDKVSKIFSVHPNTLRNWDKTGKLKAVRIGVRKDRRYENETVEKLYLKLQPSVTKKIETIKDYTAEDLPEPEVSKYVIQPEWSWAKVKLLWISKKFSVFVYSVSLIAFAFLTIQVTFFAYIFMVQADESPFKTYNIILEPTEVSGWMSAENAKQIDLLSTSPQNDFTKDNSAYFNNKPIKVLGDEDEIIPVDPPAEVTEVDVVEETLSEDLVEDSTTDFDPVPVVEGVPVETVEEVVPEVEIVSKQDNIFKAWGYSIPESVPDTALITQILLYVSFAADTFPDNEDVVILSYSIDDGESWMIARSISLYEAVSNATNEGYFEFIIDNIYELEDFTKFQVKLDYNAVPGADEATAYLDGLFFDVELQEAEKIITEIEESVNIDDTDLEVGEQPVITIDTEERSTFSFLGVGPKQRSVSDIEIEDPKGEIIEAVYAVEKVDNGKIKTDRYTFDSKNFDKPGKYRVKMVVEQDGVKKDVWQDFTWGVLAINPDFAIQKVDQETLFSIGVLDHAGDIVCNADVVLDIVDPNGHVVTRKTSDGSIIISEYCQIKGEFHGPDYFTTYTSAIPGTYQLNVTATHYNGTNSITDTFQIQEEPVFTIQRNGPTRVFPYIFQPMTLTVTANEDFNGDIKEIVSGDYELKDYSDAVLGQHDSGTEILHTLTWNRSIKAGESIELTYNFKTPEVSPALYFIGPASVGLDWDEGRQWQMAIDATYLYLLGADSSPGTGWTNITTYNGDFVRGASAFSTSGGAATHTHTFSTGVGSGSTNTGPDTGCSRFCDSLSSGGHTHTANTTTLAPANNEPANHTYYLYRYDTLDSTPNTVPLDAFAFFKTGSEPSSPWVRFTAADNRLVKLDSSHTTGGSDTHNHGITWGSLQAGVGGADVGGISDAKMTAVTHTHTAPSSPTTTANATSVPENVTLKLYEQNGTPPSVPTGMIALFDGTPPDGWTTISNASPYQNRYIQTANSSGTTGGSTGVAHSNTVGTSGVTSSQNDSPNVAGSQFATNDHTHNITLSGYNAPSHDPLQINFILAECTSCGAAPSGVDLTGKAYTDDTESTPITTGTSVCVAVNGSSSDCDATDSSGEFIITDVTTSPDDQLTFFIDGGSILGNTVTVGDGNAIVTGDNLRIYQNTVMVRAETGTSLEIVEMDAYDNDQNATDMLYDASDLATDTLVLESNIELFVYSGHTFNPNGTVTTAGTGDFDVRGTAYLDTDTNTIADQILLPTGGTLTISANTNVNFDGIAVSVTGGTLNHTGGILNVGNGTLEDISITSGVANFSGGTTNIKDELDISGGTITISNTFNLSNAASIFEVIGGTVNINAGADVNLSDRLYLHGNGAIINVNGGSIDSVDYWLLYEGTFNFNGGTHKVSTGAATGSMYFNGSGTGITFNMTGSGTIETRELESSNNTRNHTGTVTGGTIIINGDNPTLGLNVWEVDGGAGMDFYNVTISGTTTVNALNTANIINDLTINSGQTLTTNGATLDIDGDILINSTGVFEAGSSAINLKGNYTNSGTFTDGTSIFSLVGTGTQTLSGNMTGPNAFNILTVTNTNGTYSDGSCGTPSAYGVVFSAAMSTGTLNMATAGVKAQFLAGATYTVSSNLNLQGGSGNRVVLRSSTTSAWTLSAPVTQTITYVDVSYSTATGNAVVATDGTSNDCLNNTNWTWPSTSINVSGSSNTTGTVKIAINGTLQTGSYVISASAWNIDTDTEPNAGDTITAFINGVNPGDVPDNNESTAVTEYDGGDDIVGMVLNSNVLSIGSGDAGVSLTVTQLGQYDNDDDEDIMHSANTNVLTVDDDDVYDTDSIDILFADELTISGTETLTAYSVNITGAITSTGGSAYNINGDWNNGGTFTANSSTVTIGGTGGSINGGNDTTFYNLVIDTTGDFNDVTIGGGTDDPIVTNNLTIASNDILSTASGRTITINSTASFTFNGYLDGNGTFVYKPSAAFPTSGTLTNPIVVRFDSSDNNQIISVRNYLGVEIYGNNSSNTVTAAAGTYTINNLTISQDGSGNTNFNLNTNDPTLLISTTTSIGANTTLTASSSTVVTFTGDFTNNGTVTGVSGGTLNFKGDYTNNGTFADGLGTVLFSGTSKQIISGTLTGSSDFYNLTITNNSGTTPAGCTESFTPSIEFIAAATISGTYTITTNNVRVEYLQGATYTVTNLNWAATSGNEIIFRNSSTSSGSWQLDVDVSGTQAVSYVDVAGSDAVVGNTIVATDETNTDCGSNANWDFGGTPTGILVSGVTDGTGLVKIAIGTTLQTSSSTINGGVWNVYTDTVPISGNLIVAFIDNVIDANESTAVTEYVGNDITGMVLNQNVLSIGSDATISFDVGEMSSVSLYQSAPFGDEDIMFGCVFTASCPLLVDDDGVYTSEKIDIMSGTTLTMKANDDIITHDLEINGTLVTTGPTNDISLSGSWDNNGAFTSTSESIVFNSTSIEETMDNTGATDYDVNNVTFSGSGQWTLTTALTANGNLTTTDGTLILGNLSHTVGGNLDFGGGAVTEGGSTITMTGTSNSIAGGGITLYNLTIDPTTAGTITLQTADLLVSGTLNVASGDTLSIDTSRTLTHIGSSNIAGTGTISGAGTLRFTDVSGGPGTTITTMSSIVLFDASAGDIANTTFDARTYGGDVELYGNNSSNSITAATGSYPIAGDLILTQDGTGATTIDLNTNDPTVTVTGNVSIDTATTLSASSSSNLDLNGSYTNNGTFTDNAGAVILSGTSTQTLSGTMTGSSSFNNLIVTNTYGSVTGCNLLSTKGIDFAASATVTGTFTVNDNAHIEFNSGSTYAFTNIDWTGTSGNDIVFRSSTTSAWNLNVTNSSVVSYVDVAYSDATPGVDIDSDDGTNTDCSNNIAWLWIGTNVTGDTDSASGTIKIAVNGTLQADSYVIDGTTWNVYTDSALTGGETITAFVNDATTANESTGVTMYDGGGDITGMVLDRHVLSIGSVDNPSMNTSSDFPFLNNDDEDVMMEILLGGGVATFYVDRQSGVGQYTDDKINILSGATLTVTSIEDPSMIRTLDAHDVQIDGTLTASGPSDFDISGSWDNNSDFNSSGAETITFTSTSTETMDNTGASDYDVNNITFNGSGGQWTMATAQVVAGNLITTNGTLVLGSSSHTVGGNLNIAGGVVTAGGSTITMTGTSNTITGGGKTLNNLTIDPASSGTITLGTSNLTISNNLNVANGDTLSIDPSQTLTHIGSSNIAGTGTISGAGTLRFTDVSGGPGTTITTMSSIVLFDASAGDIANTTFDARTYGGDVELYGNNSSNSITAASGTYNIGGNLTLTQDGTGATMIDLNTNDPTMTIDGNVSIDASTTLSASSANTMTVKGNWTNGGTFTHNSGTVTFSGSSTQTLSGTMTGSSSFNNLIVTNAGGSNPDVDFAVAAEVNNNFTADTASSQLEFNAGSTYTFNNVSFNGTSGNLVTLRSSSPDTQWNLTSAGTQTVTYTDVQDSNACGGDTIDASGGTNVNSQNNDCWLFVGITVSISPNNIDLGTLTTGLVSQDGVTLTVSTDASNGYSSTVYYDNTLTSVSSDTISDTSGGTIVAGTEEFGASSSRSGYTIAQWSPTSCSDTGTTSNATTLTTSPQTFAGATSAVSSEQTTLCILGSITGLTEAGSYTSTITIVATGLF